MMHPFAAYLQQHHLNALTVAHKARVRYLTVWNATPGNPITRENARRIQRTVMLLTHRPYIGPLGVFPEETLSEQPTAPLALFVKQQTPWTFLWEADILN